MTTQTLCDECGKPITGQPLMHVISTSFPPAHEPVDLCTAACFAAWDDKTPREPERVTGL